VVLVVDVVLAVDAVLAIPLGVALAGRSSALLAEPPAGALGRVHLWRAVPQPQVSDRELVLDSHPRRLRPEANCGPPEGTAAGGALWGGAASRGSSHAAYELKRSEAPRCERGLVVELLAAAFSTGEPLVSAPASRWRKELLHTGAPASHTSRVMRRSAEAAGQTRQAAVASPLP
jgi:hypothetical protein